MKIELIEAPIEFKPVIKNLARFYVYELSKYNGDNPDAKFPEDGLYVAYDRYFHFDNYWIKPGFHPFIIRVNYELAGFVLIDKKGSTPNIDWYMAEFFVVAKFQGKGVGKNIATQIFNRFPGMWEIMQMPENIPAIRFWDKVVKSYTRGDFSKELKIIAEPEPHEMIVLTFNTAVIG